MTNLGSPMRVLLVESDPKIGAQLANYLSNHHPFQCTVATCPQTALDLARNALPPFDLALINDQLNSASNEKHSAGVELAGEFNMLRQPLTVVIFTQIPPKRDRAAQARAVGVTHYIVKPFRLKQLGNVLAHAAELSQLRQLAKEHKLLEQMKTLAELCRDVNSALDLDQVLAETCRGVQHLVHADHSGLVLFESNLEFGIVRAEFPVLGIGRRKIPLRGIPLEEELIRTQKPIAISDVAASAELGIVKDTLLELHIHSILLVPIVTKNQVIGSLSLDFVSHSHTFTPDEIELCEFFAIQIAPAIENAHLFERTKTRANELVALRTTMLEMTSSRREELLDTILNQAIQLLQARNGGIYFFMREWGELHVIADHKWKEHIGTKLKVGEGMAGRLILGGDYLIVNDYRTWLGRSRQYETTNHFEAVIEVQLVWHDEPIGILYLEADTERNFSKKDAELLQLFADQATIALKAAEQRNQDLAQTTRLQRLAELIPEIMKPIGEGQIDVRLDLVAENIARLLNAETGGVFITRGPDTIALEASYGHRNGMFQKGHPFEIRTGMRGGLTGHIAYKRETFQANGVRLKDFYAVTGGTASHTPSGECLSLLVEPVLREKGGKRELLGMLRADNKKGSDGRANSRFKFDETDIYILKIIAGATRHLLEAIAWEQHVRAQQSRHDRMVTALQQIARAMVTGDLKTTLEAAAEGVKDAAGCDIVILYRYDPLNGKLDHPPVYTEGLKYPDEVAQTDHVPSHSIVYKMMELEAPRVVPDVELDTDFCGRSFTRREQIRSVIALPLRVLHRPVGVLFVNYHERREFPQDDLDLLQIFAAQAATAIDNAGFEQTLTKLYESSKTITGKSTLKQILPEIAKRAIELLDNRDTSPHCFSYIALKKGDHLDFVAAYPSEWLSVLDWVEPIHPAATKRGIIGRAVYEKSRYQNIPNVREDEDYIELSPLTNSQLVVMIKSGDEIVGAFGIEHGATDAFTANDIKKVKTLASQAAVAIELARAMDDASWLGRKFNVLLNLSQHVGASNHLSETLELACHAAVDLLKVDHSGLVLFDEDFIQGQIEAEYPDKGILGRWIPLRGIPLEEQLIATRQPIYVPDAGTAEEFGPIRSIFEKIGTRSLLMVPIVVNDKLIGSFGLDMLGRTRKFSNEELELCKAFAAQMGVAIAHARLYDERSREAERLTSLQRETWDRDQFIELLEHLHFNTPGYAVSSLDLLFQGELGRVRLNRRQRQKLEAVREDLRAYKDFQEILRHAGHAYSETVRPRENISVQLVVQQVLKHLAQTAVQRGVRIQPVYRTDGWICANFDMLTVAVLQLVANAIKFSQAEGKITIELECSENTVELRIDDQGCGIPPELRSQLGKPGFRANDHEKGSGVGLAFAMNFIQANGGELVFPEKQENGFLAIIRFPAIACGE